MEEQVIKVQDIKDLKGKDRSKSEIMTMIERGQLKTYTLKKSGIQIGSSKDGPKNDMYTLKSDE